VAAVAAEARRSVEVPKRVRPVATGLSAVETATTLVSILLVVVAVVLEVQRAMRPPSEVLAGWVFLRLSREVQSDTEVGVVELRVERLVRPARPRTAAEQVRQTRQYRGLVGPTGKAAEGAALVKPRAEAQQMTAATAATVCA
jgi:hypothetical protein